MLDLVGILFGVQARVADTPEQYPASGLRHFLRKAAADLCLATYGSMPVEVCRELIKNIRVTQPFGRDALAFPPLASLSAQGKSSLPDQPYSHFGRTTLVKLGLPKELWDLGQGSLRYYISDDSYARKVHYDCKMIMKPLRPLASACFLPHVEICRTRKEMLWE